MLKIISVTYNVWVKFFHINGLCLSFIEEICVLCAAVGAILSATDSVCTLQVKLILVWSYEQNFINHLAAWLFILPLKVLSQDETPFLYSVVFGEGVVNDATSIVLFNAVQALDFSNIDASTALKLLGTFLYLLFSSTALGIVVSFSLLLVWWFCKLLLSGTRNASLFAFGCRWVL